MLRAMIMNNKNNTMFAKRVFSMALGLTLLVSYTATYAVALGTHVSQSAHKDFQINVTKQSSLLVEPTMPEVLTLDIESLVDLDMAADSSGNITAPPIPIPLGELTLETSASNCLATVTTHHNFALKGLELGKTLATYEILYSTSDNATNAPTVFGMNHPSTQIVECDTAFLDFTLLSINVNTPEDEYDDVIRVTLKAES